MMGGGAALGVCGAGRSRPGGRWSWQITLAALAMIPVFLIPARLIGRRLQRLTGETMQLDAEMSSMMNERFNVASAMLTKLYGRSADEASLFAGRAGGVRDVAARSVTWGRLLVVVLDEATAHLDSESEAAIQRALKTALAGRTSLVIAHRLSTIRDADQILVVEAGRVLKRGTHEELLRCPTRTPGLPLAVLRRAGLARRGGPDGVLRHLRPATVRHPVTGAEVWFNQADQFHFAGLGEHGADVRELLPEDELPQSVTFADGSPIPAESSRTSRRPA
jgi:hypothetical protein